MLKEVLCVETVAASIVNIRIKKKTRNIHIAQILFFETFSIVSFSRY